MVMGVLVPVLEAAPLRVELDMYDCMIYTMLSPWEL